MGKKSKSKKTSKFSSIGGTSSSSAKSAAVNVNFQGDAQDMQIDSKREKVEPEAQNDSDTNADARIEVVEEDGDEMVIDIEVDESAGGDGEGDSDVDDNGDNVQRLEDGDESDEDGNGKDGSSNTAPPIPFMDTFYSLSSDSPGERAVAAHCLIRHCFPSSHSTTSAGIPPVQPKDAAYALKRLMTGLCSGRAGARQGYASALASFLKVSFATTVEDEEGRGEKMLAIRLIQKQSRGSNDNDEEMPEDSDDSDGNDDDDDESDSVVSSSAEFVRRLLIAQTTPTQPSKRGSEERDYIFGRLFGIMAVVRSGTLSAQDVPLAVSGIEIACLRQHCKRRSWCRQG